MITYFLWVLVGINTLSAVVYAMMKSWWRSGFHIGISVALLIVFGLKGML